MSERMLWTELVMDLFPIGNERGAVSFLVVRSVRFLCLFSIFVVTGVAAFIIDGMVIPGYLGDSFTALTVVTAYFGFVGFLIFAISGWFRNRWDWFFNWAPHQLSLSESEFARLRNRLEGFINSFFPCLVIAIVLFVGLDIMSMLGRLYVSAVWMWWVFQAFFRSLLFGTGVWMLISMWIAIFLTFRQPLRLKLSRMTNEEFKPLAFWGLETSLLSFIFITVNTIVVRSGFSTMPWGTTLFIVTTGSLIFLAVLAFLLPFYNIHLGLVKLKEQELQKIEEESTRIIQELTETMTNSPAQNSKDNTTHIIYSLTKLQILQIREKRATEADEWPINMTILSILAGIVLTPILTQIVINAFFTIFAP